MCSRKKATRDQWNKLSNSRATFSFWYQIKGLQLVEVLKTEHQKILLHTTSLILTKNSSVFNSLCLIASAGTRKQLRISQNGWVQAWLNSFAKRYTMSLSLRMLTFLCIAFVPFLQHQSINKTCLGEVNINALKLIPVNLFKV